MPQRLTVRNQRPTPPTLQAVSQRHRSQAFLDSIPVALVQQKVSGPDASSLPARHHAGMTPTMTPSPSPPPRPQVMLGPAQSSGPSCVPIERTSAMIGAAAVAKRALSQAPKSASASTPKPPLPRPSRATPPTPSKLSSASAPVPLPTRQVASDPPIPRARTHRSRMGSDVPACVSPMRAHGRCRGLACDAEVGRRTDSGTRWSPTCPWLCLTDRP